MLKLNTNTNTTKHYFIDILWKKCKSESEYKCRDMKILLFPKLTILTSHQKKTFAIFIVLSYVSILYME